VRSALARGAFLDHFGVDRIFETKQEAITAIYAKLDVEVCRRCKARIFNECQTTLPDGSARSEAAQT
jgi:SulP family sulfate permease